MNVPALTVLATATLLVAAPLVRAEGDAPAVPQPLPAPVAAPLPAPLALPTQLALREGDPADVLIGPGAELVAERSVKGAPYCADAVHETVQWLPDPAGGAANRIVRRQQTRLCRDGEGRTRQEVERDGKRRIYLRDPVARESWVLDPQQRSARRLAGSRGGPEHDSAAWRDYAERMREWARSFSERMKGTHGAAASSTSTATSSSSSTTTTVTTLSGAPPMPPVPPVPAVPAVPPVPPVPPAPVLLMADEASGTREVQVRVVRGGEAGAWEMPAPTTLSLQGSLLAPRGPGVLTALGSKDIDGVRAGGERTTWTIEAGKVGNEKPIVITREVWRSPDLLLTLQSSDFDPRIGETRYRLTNLKRGEPEAGLMQVPADYSRRGVPAPAAPASPPARGRG